MTGDMWRGTDISERMSMTGAVALRSPGRHSPAWMGNSGLGQADVALPSPLPFIHTVFLAWLEEQRRTTPMRCMPTCQSMTSGLFFCSLEEEVRQTAARRLWRGCRRQRRVANDTATAK